MDLPGMGERYVSRIVFLYYYRYSYYLEDSPAFKSYTWQIIYEGRKVNSMK